MDVVAASPRPRERLALQGAAALSPVELIAVVLGTGRPGESALRVAERILGAVGGLAPLSRMRAAELATLPGLGPARAARLAASFALGRRALWAGPDPNPILSTPAEADDYLRPHLAGLGHEVFWVVGLTARNRVIDAIEVSRGSLTGVDVHPREVFRFLIAVRAAAGLIAHNHPSGDPAPSCDDLALTERLVAIGHLVGVPIIDHVIVASSGFRSILAAYG